VAFIKLKIVVNHIDNVVNVAGFDQIKVYRSTTEQAGPYSEISGPGTRPLLDENVTLYEFIDSAGSSDYWYAFSFFNSVSLAEGTRSVGIRGQGVQGQYCTIQSLRDEGVTDPPYSDTRLTNIIKLASAMIDKWTGRWFSAKQLDLTFDGSGERSLHLDVPIIAITEAYLEDTEIDLDGLVVYNRHITQDLTRPDDRDAPRVEIAQAFDYTSPLYAEGLRVWPRGQQNVRLIGTFGYTEYDGTVDGKTPELIQHACRLLVLRELPLLTDEEDRDDIRNGWRLKQVKTRDQSISWASPAGMTLGRTGVGQFSGDPEIDTIIMGFRRPHMMRAV
jgi:hypothetical protein